MAVLRRTTRSAERCAAALKGAPVARRQARSMHSWLMYATNSVRLLLAPHLAQQGCRHSPASSSKVSICTFASACALPIHPRDDMVSKSAMTQVDSVSQQYRGGESSTRFEEAISTHKHSSHPQRSSACQTVYYCKQLRAIMNLQTCSVRPRTSAVHMEHATDWIQVQSPRFIVSRLLLPWIALNSIENFQLATMCLHSHGRACAVVRACKPRLQVLTCCQQTCIAQAVSSTHVFHMRARLQ